MNGAAAPGCLRGAAAACSVIQGQGPASIASSSRCVRYAIDQSACLRLRHECGFLCCIHPDSACDSIHVLMEKACRDSVRTCELIGR